MISTNKKYEPRNVVYTSREIFENKVSINFKEYISFNKGQIFEYMWNAFFEDAKFSIVLQLALCQIMSHEQGCLKINVKPIIVNTIISCRLINATLFFNPHELTKKVLQNFMGRIISFDQGNWTITVVPFFQHNIQNRTRLKGPAFRLFSALWDLFSKNYSMSPKGPP